MSKRTPNSMPSSVHSLLAYKIKRLPLEVRVRARQLAKQMLDQKYPRAASQDKTPKK